MRFRQILKTRGGIIARGVIVWYNERISSGIRSGQSVASVPNQVRGGHDGVPLFGQKRGHTMSTITVKIRFSDFKTITRQKKSANLTDRDDILFSIARALFLDNYRGEAIRLIGVSASGLMKNDNAVCDPMFIDERKRSSFDKVSDSIKDRFGENSIRRGGSIQV